MNVVLDPAIRSFLDSLKKSGGKPIYALTPQEARQVLLGAQTISVDLKPAMLEKLTVPSKTGQDIPITIVCPEKSQESLPIIMYFHGGGWVLGDFSTHERLFRELSHGVGAAVVYVDYDRAPESQFPVAQEQAYAATEWIYKNGASFSLDINRIAIAGDSVGGHMATTVAMMAKERKGPPLVFQLLCYPVTDASLATQSYEQFSTGFFLEKKGMEWFWDSYVPDKSKRNNPLVSVLQAPLEQLRGLPPALVITGECDVLRDEGEAYAHKLMQAGVVSVGVRYAGVIHDFMMLNAFTQAPPVRAAVAQAIDTLKRVLQKN